MARAGQPEELAPTYVYLASEDSSYVSGQVLHVNGGTVVNGYGKAEDSRLAISGLDTFRFFFL